MKLIHRAQNNYLNPIRAFQASTTWDQKALFAGIHLLRQADSIINTLEKSVLVTRIIPGVVGVGCSALHLFYNRYNEFDSLINLALLINDFTFFFDTAAIGVTGICVLSFPALTGINLTRGLLSSLEAHKSSMKAQRAFTQTILKNYFDRLPEAEREEEMRNFADLMPDVETIFSRVIIEQMTVCPDRPTTENTPHFLHSELDAIWELQDQFRKLPRKFRRKFSLLSDLPKKGPVTKIDLIKTGIIRVAGQWLYNHPRQLLPLVQDRFIAQG